MKNKLLNLAFVSFLLGNIGCSTQEKKEDKIMMDKSKEINLNIPVVRLEQEIFKDKSKVGIQQFLKNHPAFNKKYFGKFFPNDDVTVAELYKGINNPSVDTLYQNTQEVFGDMSDLKLQFEEASKRIMAVYPKHKPQQLNTFISGMGFWGGDMYVDDSLVVISLDFFLGKASKYEPNLPLYILKRYRKEYIIPYIVTLIGNKYSKTDFLDNSLVAEMIYYGKVYYFLEQVMPEIHDTILTGYTKVELEEVESHQDVIWSHFIEKKVLFETKHEITNKYVGERPNTTEIGNKCPGRIGRWLGWQIVKRYIEQNSKANLVDLMNEKDAKKIFNESKYKPLLKK